MWAEMLGTLGFPVNDCVSVTESEVLMSRSAVYVLMVSLLQISMGV